MVTEAAGAGDQTADGIQIGSKLREWRLAARRTLTEVAEASNLSIGYISQVERGLANPSLETLKRLADVLGRTVGELFVDGTSRIDTERYAVTRQGHRKKLHYPGSGIINELLSPDLRHRMEVIWVEAPTGATSGGHPHSHEGEECGLVLAGQMAFWVGDDAITLGPGDSIYLDSTLPHRWEATGDDGLRAVWLISPPTF